MLNPQTITDRLDQYSKALADDKGAIAFKIRLEIERHCVDDLRALLAENTTLRNELCLRCGLYRNAHNGACNGCRWHKED